MDNYQGSDFYCDMALKQKDMLDIIYEDDFVMAFYHTKPFWHPVHIVIIPKEHIVSFVDFQQSQGELVDRVLSVARDIARQVTEQYGAARILTNLGDYQDSKHFHVHVSSGEPKVSRC